MPVAAEGEAGGVPQGRAGVDVCGFGQGFSQFADPAVGNIFKYALLSQQNLFVHEATDVHKRIYYR